MLYQLSYRGTPARAAIAEISAKESAKFAKAFPTRSELFDAFDFRQEVLE